MHQPLDKLDVIECFEGPGHSLRIGEILDKQTAIYEALNVMYPSSSSQPENPGYLMESSGDWSVTRSYLSEKSLKALAYQAAWRYSRNPQLRTFLDGTIVDRVH